MVHEKMKMQKTWTLAQLILICKLIKIKKNKNTWFEFEKNFNFINQSNFS